MLKILLRFVFVVIVIMIIASCVTYFENGEAFWRGHLRDIQKKFNFQKEENCPHSQCDIADLKSTIRIPDDLINESGMDHSFVIDKYEVSIYSYRIFLTETNREFSFQTCGENRLKGFFEKNSENNDEAAPCLPVTCVTYHDAKAYCQWKGMRLCLPEEWKLACQGSVTGNLYGYSDQYDSHRCRTQSNNRFVCSECAYPECKNELGIVNMVGNAFEWVEYTTVKNNDGDPDNYGLLLGGDVNNGAFSNCREEYFHNQDFSSETYGFRCCATVSE